MVALLALCDVLIGTAAEASHQTRIDVHQGVITNKSTNW